MVEDFDHINYKSIMAMQEFMVLYVMFEDDTIDFLDMSKEIWKVWFDL